jgi:uncharacterized protein Yka (UPF0111/DUF47 family)
MQKNILDISTACDKLNELEHIADGVYEEFITSLFKNEENVKEIVKLRDILSELENSINLTERVGKSIRTIIIKYA